MTIAILKTCLGKKSSLFHSIWAAQGREWVAHLKKSVILTTGHFAVIHKCDRERNYLRSHQQVDKVLITHRVAWGIQREKRVVSML